LHQGPTDTLALARAIDGDRPDSSDRVHQRQKVGANRLAVAEGDHAVKVVALHHHAENLLGKFHSGKVWRETMLLLKLFKGFKTDSSYLIYVLWFSGNQFDGHNLTISLFVQQSVAPTVRTA
jgi:hypothetical protein